MVAFRWGLGTNLSLVCYVYKYAYEINIYIFSSARHAHLVAFDQSDLLFVCMLKPLSYEVTIDDKEIQAAKV